MEHVALFSILGRVMLTTEIEVYMWSVASPSRHTWIAGFLKTRTGNTGSDTNLKVLSYRCGKPAIKLSLRNEDDLPVSQTQTTLSFCSRLQQTLKPNPAEGLFFIYETCSMSYSTDTCLPINAAVHLESASCLHIFFCCYGTD